MKNVFMEGMQGAGKSTLVSGLAALRPGYTPYREGDLSPVELAWCAYMTAQDYQAARAAFPHLSQAMDGHTLREEGHHVVAYTKVPGDQAFFQHMERYEIYNGRIPYEAFRQVILRRYAAYQGEGGLFECSLFQNAIETMLLYYQLPEEAILDFYRQAWAALKDKQPLILWLDVADPEAALERVKAERVDENGSPVWFAMLLSYLNSSPYGQRHPFATIQDVAAHARRRASLERRVMAEVMPGAAVILPAKAYDLQAVAKLL